MYSRRYFRQVNVDLLIIAFAFSRPVIACMLHRLAIAIQIVKADQIVLLGQFAILVKQQRGGVTIDVDLSFF